MIGHVSTRFVFACLEGARAQGDAVVGLILKLRWVAVVIALFSALHAIAFVAIGVVRGVIGYSLIVQGPPWDGDRSPGIQLARSVDAFLLAMVFFVFSIRCAGALPFEQGGFRSGVRSGMDARQESVGTQVSHLGGHSCGAGRRKRRKLRRRRSRIDLVCTHPSDGNAHPRAGTLSRPPSLIVVRRPLCDAGTPPGLGGGPPDPSFRQELRYDSALLH